MLSTSFDSDNQINGNGSKGHKAVRLTKGLITRYLKNVQFINSKVI